MKRWTLVANWKRVLKHAWSIRLIILAGLLSGAEIALPLLDGLLPVPKGVFAGLSFVATAGAFVARLVAQESVSGGGDGE
ncbi:hypothetical protein [Bosea vaviloviae]|uniref:Uncharacterized protein n=1 Tax=Bosea vaviloviae TaxID=1526658 RepID=A0A0N1F4P6_9HYPH|nr:hypothetical protein [Bosea vaviloviae]KPH80535.1 hypothetical protein AE618_12210 [Bosea vaviloviae]